MSDRERDHLQGDGGDPVEPLASGVPSAGTDGASGGAPLRETGESGRPVMLWGRIEDPRSWAPGEPPTARAVPSAAAPEAPREVPEWARSGDGAPGGPGQPPAERRPVHPGEVFVAAGAGILAALFAAVVWGLIARATGSELQVAAVGVGFAAGLGVAAAGRRGSPFTTVAVIATAVGIVVGKYLSFAFVFEEQIGFLVGHDVGVFSGATFDAFRDRLGDVFSLFDVIWFVVAVVAALLVAGGSSQQADAEGAARRHHHPMDRFTKGLPGAVRVTVDWAVTIAGAIGIVLLVKAFVVNPYRIPSSSMEPTLHCAFGESGCLARFSDRVLANRFIYHFRDPRRGEIIVFETPPEARNRCGAGGTFVKRLIGLPGETIEIRLEDGNGYVFINGQQLAEPYVKEDRRQLTQGYGPLTIPENQYFMMGDNREASCDSRDWGTVPRGNLIGNVFATYWPPQRISFH